MAARLFACLLLASPIVAAERAPMPRQVDPDRKLHELVRLIDGHFNDFWTREGITVAPPADDAEFLRRASLDLVGRIPPASEVRAFLADTDPAKRDKKVDELLARPNHIHHFATLYQQTWVPAAEENFQVRNIRPQFAEWVRVQLQKNRPMDRIVRELLTTKTLFAGRGEQAFNTPTDVSPFLFMQSNEFKPENVASAASRLFMGVKIECAQCHNHPFAPYTKEQFWQLAAFFAEVQPAIANVSDPKFKREIKIPDVPRKVQARYFDDDREPAWDAKKSPRETFVDWLVAAENPYFARNMVNRAWAQLLGRGIVEPIDEPSEDNPPVVPEALDALAKGFAESGYDHRFLMRVIARTRAYRLTSRQTHESQAEGKNFARMAVKGLTGEQLFDSLGEATGMVVRMDRETRFEFSPRSEFARRFSSPEKAVDKQMSILQALTLMNGRMIDDATSLNRSVFLAGVVDAPFLDTAGRVETLFLATVSRKPTAEEASKYGSYFDRGGVLSDKAKAVTDVFWALLNSSEFGLNH